MNDDLVALNGAFEHNWFNRTVVTLDRSDIEFGEINNNVINNEFDATILEVAFHDNELDAELMRDAKVRDAVARASYQGIVRYFSQVHGAAPLVMAPDAVGDLAAFASAPGEITVRWSPPAANASVGDAPTAYRIYSSQDGLGFDGGTLVGATSHTFSGLDATDGPRFFKVAALNAGGESPARQVVAATPGDADPSDILIVNGFDRLGRSQNPRQPFGGGFTDRVRPRESNAFDYAVPVADAIAAHDPRLTFDTVQNETVASVQVLLANYDAVVWVLGEESSADATFDLAEQALVSAYLDTGGRLFLSGAEIGWDLDWLNNGRAFYHDSLQADYVADDANTYDVQGEPGSIFEGLSLTFDNGSQYYDTNFPDVIVPRGTADTGLTYVGGPHAGEGAAIVFDGGEAGGDVVMLGFPFETIVNASQRQAVMARALEFMGIVPATLRGDADNDARVTGADLIAVQQNFGRTEPGPPSGLLAGDANDDGQVTGADLIAVQEHFGQALTAPVAPGAAVATNWVRSQAPAIESVPAPLLVGPAPAQAASTPEPATPPRARQFTAHVPAARTTSVIDLLLPEIL